MCPESCVLWTFCQHYLQILSLGFYKVHEVVQVRSCWFGGVGEVGFLHCHQQGGGEQPVTKDKFASRNVNLNINKL